jgi:bifunctional N-acetylglucosamine-1-phosphate-uridyltransferase/glucosamine-1-phosphate-acetyltransferase GlmU-like protein
MEKSIVAIVMAGGLGKRMESDIPKVLHKINGMPMIIYILKNLINLNKRIHLEKILIVVGKYRYNIQKEIEKYSREYKIQ